jgi:hypothetical protein
LVDEVISRWFITGGDFAGPVTDEVFVVIEFFHKFIPTPFGLILLLSRFTIFSLIVRLGAIFERSGNKLCGSW